MRYVWDFDEPSEGGKALLGGKGAGLAEMTQIGMPVCGGFTVSTDACRAYMRESKMPEGLDKEVDEHIVSLEQKSGKKFGDLRDPLLVSVRSGAAVSMPGMMDTVLNLGLNDAAAAGLAKATGNPRFAYDCYRRLVQMYGEVVDGIEPNAFEDALTELKEKRGVKNDAELTADDLKELADTFIAIYEKEKGHKFPQDPREQLMRSIEAVFDSWETPRARVYRDHAGIPHDLGTAVNICQMVFGNRGENCGTGVCFTRNPSTGEQGLYGEFLLNAQGEDVVAGIRTPLPLEEMEKPFPQAFKELVESMEKLEQYYKDMQDMEFTIEEGKLYLLQTRSAKRTARAALRAAVSMVEEGLIDKEEAVKRINPDQLDQLLHPMIDPKAKIEVAAKGLNASPGAASGKAVFDADTAAELGKAGESVILIRPETTPDDIHGMLVSKGVLTTRGGMTSHASVVARGLGIPCVAGCEALVLDLGAKKASMNGKQFSEGDIITIDGGNGSVIIGAVPLVPPSINDDFRVILEWADGFRRLGVRANGDTPDDAAKAREFGAEGIGLCRTEHMFMAAERLPVVQEMILATTTEDRKVALDKLLPMQQSDFEGIFEAMEGLPVTIRLLDPPLHEFLPKLEETDDPHVRERIVALHEFNPMLGTRGCRLGILYPEIFEMQVRAIVRAAKAVEKRTGKHPRAEIMHPLIGFAEELRRMRELTERVIEEEKAGEFPIGTMIELPRACVRADEIAEYADFFSFGTNDLTQTTMGISRDDAEGKFLTKYIEDGVIAQNPFASLDQAGVGDLMKLGLKRGRSVKEDLKTGICGEHGGDPVSVTFCHNIGLDYVSCSPFRVPLARLAAAQAALNEASLAAAEGRSIREAQALAFE
ncbi:MAG: pyruvate, phosphate dikinase [Gaiellaceae bacterium]